jgi:hypothetical protein
VAAKTWKRNLQVHVCKIFVDENFISEDVRIIPMLTGVVIAKMRKKTFPCVSH